MKSAEKNVPERCPVTGKHRQKTVRTTTGERFLVDQGIAQLIQDCQRLGIRTIGSCEASCGGWCNRRHKRLPDTREYNKSIKKWITVFNYKKPKVCKESVWIVFNTAEDGRNFLNAVFSAEDSEKLQSYMLGGGKRALRTKHWTWGILAEDINDHRVMNHKRQWEGERVGPPLFEFMCGVVFPRSHLKLVSKRMHKAAEEYGVEI